APARRRAAATGRGRPGARRWERAEPRPGPERPPRVPVAGPREPQLEARPRPELPRGPRMPARRGQAAPPGGGGGGGGRRGGGGGAAGAGATAAGVATAAGGGAY